MLLGPDRGLLQLAQLAQGVRIEIRHGLVSRSVAGPSPRPGKRELKVHVEGPLVFNGTSQMLNATLDGFGPAHLPEDLAQPHLAEGRLDRVIED